MKTNIILPYKDRFGKYKQSLDSFLLPFIIYLDNFVEDYEICIVEQSGGLVYDNEELFNLGRAINIGFDILCKNSNDNDTFIYHPVDILPIDTNYLIDKCTKFCSSSHSPDGKYAKSLGFKCWEYKKINGHSNQYWGWGLEDDDVFNRLHINDIQVNTLINDYENLGVDGNGYTFESHFMPTYLSNYQYLDELILSKDCSKSGLNDLNYEILEKTTYKNVTKYIIK